MGYVNYAGVTLTQSDGDYDWLANETTPVSLSPGVDTVKIWQSYTLPDNANNLIVFGDGNYAAGNDQANVIKAVASNNLIYGAGGDDVFVGDGSTTYVVAQGEGDKVIQNFTEGGDKLRLIGGPLTSFGAVQSDMSQKGADVLLDDGGAKILFRDAMVGQFTAADFQLPLTPASLGAQTYNENFDSPSTIGANFQTNFGYAGTGLNSYTLPHNAELELYTDPSFQGTASAPLGLNPFSFNSGVLTISATPMTAAQSAQAWGYHYSSGMLESNFTQTYGYFEMRAELPQGQGLWPAFWLLGPDNNEVDVLEALGSNLKVSNNAVHSNDEPALGNASFNPYATGFHTYGVLWSPQTLTYYVDGAPVWQTATPADMNAPMHMVVNLAVGGNWPGAPDPTTPFPANMQIDYIHAYALGDGTAPASAPAPVTPTDPAAGLVLTAGDAAVALAGGPGTDTLIAGHGADTLTGGAGADLFAYGATPWNAGKITDFAVGVDHLDFSKLFAAAGYSGADPVADGHVILAGDGAGGTNVLFDPDGPASGNPWPFTIVDLVGVSPAGLTWSALSGSGSTAFTPGAPPSGRRPDPHGRGQFRAADRGRRAPTPWWPDTPQRP